jgi:hypothetical protein
MSHAVLLDVGFHFQLSSPITQTSVVLGSIAAALLLLGMKMN